MDMETSKQSTGPEKSKAQSKDLEQPVKPKQTSPARSLESKEESPDASSDEEPGTFDRVYEHGRQMGF
jgi:hypothetical protein